MLCKYFLEYLSLESCFYVNLKWLQENIMQNKYKSYSLYLHRVMRSLLIEMRLILHLYYNNIQ